MRKSWLALLASFIFLHCTVSEDDPGRSIVGNRYDNPDLGISLQFPLQWQLKLDQVFGETKYDLVGIDTTATVFRPNLTLMYSVPTTTGKTWDEVLAMVKTEVTSQIKDAGQYHDTILVNNGITYASVSFTTTSLGNLLKIKNVLIRNRNKEITLTYTALASNFDLNSDLAQIQASMLLR